MMMGLVLILGLYLEKTRILDVGTLLLVSSFFFLIQDIPFNYLNFIFILFMIFFFFELWVFMKRELFVKGIEKDLVGNEGIIYLEEYKEHSARYYVKSLFMGLFVSAAGGSIAVHSFIGPFPSGFSLFLNVLFSSMVLFGLYSVMFLVPKYFILE
ncbi:MAG: hypothetical protein ACOCSJ_02410 [Candidatus Natronoplasma sp.]